MAETQFDAKRRILAITFAAPLMLGAAVCASEAEHGAGKTVTYSSPKENYPMSPRGYQISNNAWGAGKLVEGVDYSTSVTYDPDNFKSGATFSWRFPRNAGGVYAYPHINYGTKYAGVSTQTADIAELSASYDVSLSNPSETTLAFDLWFNSRPNGPWATTVAELLIEVHATSRGKPNQRFLLSGSGFSGATVYVSSMSAAGASWKFINVKMPADIMSGTLSISDILKGLVLNGVLTGQEYLASLQFGSEVRGGTGGLRVNSLSYQWTENPYPARGAGAQKQ